MGDLELALSQTQKRALHQLKGYSEVREWRDRVSHELGSQHIIIPFDHTNHWCSQWTSEDTPWDSIELNFQIWNTRTRLTDNNCSLYSLYHQLEQHYDMRPLQTHSPYNIFLVIEGILSALQQNWQPPTLQIWGNWSTGAMILNMTRLCEQFLTDPVSSTATAFRYINARYEEDAELTRLLNQFYNP